MARGRHRGASRVGDEPGGEGERPGRLAHGEVRQDGRREPAAAIVAAWAEIEKALRERTDDPWKGYEWPDRAGHLERAPRKRKPADSA